MIAAAGFLQLKPGRPQLSLTLENALKNSSAAASDVPMRAAAGGGESGG